MSATALQLDSVALVKQAQVNPRWFAENILNLRVLKGEMNLEQDPNKSWELDIWQGQLLDAMAESWTRLLNEP